MNRLWRESGSLRQRILLYMGVAGVLLGSGLSVTGCGSSVGDQQVGDIDQGLIQTADNGIFKLDGNLMTVALADEGVTLQVEWCQPDLVRTEYLMKDQVSEDTSVKRHSSASTERSSLG